MGTNNCKVSPRVRTAGSRTTLPELEVFIVESIHRGRIPGVTVDSDIWLGIEGTAREVEPYFSWQTACLHSRAHLLIACPCVVHNIRLPHYPRCMLARISGKQNSMDLMSCANDLMLNLECMPECSGGTIRFRLGGIVLKTYNARFHRCLGIPVPSISYWIGVANLK